MFESQAHAMAGDATRAREALAEADVLAAKLGTKFYIAMRKTYLATCMLAQGEQVRQIGGKLLPQISFD